ncbi:MAG TPA: PP2C family protein-serine/threonine phosphatase [Segeticoccus sp.]|uniref:PP2C family protein-serine/threonine phosphatase n=1 Tax=Segeticoccus sp. TaxID=2706531 RepID=UPI002D7E9C44|nr:PP2C family protein-serine/threonine phosphatase [Segeticoccus sp.]HET8602088.1 PP2C family protein-serine/threonine phosphatase [Segeticoccus sp.]
MASHAEVLARQRQPAAVTRSARMRALSRVPLAAVLIVLAGLASWGIVLAPTWVPWSVFVPLAVAAGLFLSAAEMRLVLAVVFICFTISAVIVLTTGITKPNLPGTAIGFVVVVAMMVSVARSRARLGVQGGLGETMLVDLRDRLRVHGELPPLPASWHAESALYSAHGEAFSGDFVVADRTRTEDADRLEIGLFDVSGKGVGAGTRSLLLSGAFGGLLGAMQPPEFLPAANAYLLRQDWQEGFATAIHVTFDLDSGQFAVSSAGHPPAVQYHAGSGLWKVLRAQHGPLLGVIPDAQFPRQQGCLEPGDALLIYTDGVIERRDRDLDVGIDGMLGVAERYLGQGFSGAAERICGAAVAGEMDDRAVVMVWRT